MMERGIVLGLFAIGLVMMGLGGYSTLRGLATGEAPENPAWPAMVFLGMCFLLPGVFELRAMRRERGARRRGSVRIRVARGGVSDRMAQAAVGLLFAAMGTWITWVGWSNPYPSAPVAPGNRPIMMLVGMLFTVAGLSLFLWGVRRPGPRGSRGELRMNAVFASVFAIIGFAWAGVAAYNLARARTGQEAYERVGLVLVGLVFGGVGALALRHWLREARPARREEGPRGPATDPLDPFGAPPAGGAPPVPSTPRVECPHCHRTVWLPGGQNREKRCPACGLRME
ncbi:MAG: hypothetical protein HY558_04910 [Euryarchaeota archaeon]|nr:hypothetical protein [Euryarchaeota archaeon]